MDVRGLTKPEDQTPLVSPGTQANGHVAPEFDLAAMAVRRKVVKQAYIPEDPLLNVAEAAKETGRAVSTFWRDVRAGLLPAAYYVTPRSPRWRRSELRACVYACPRRNR
jgi:predicted DNA-binding transcriptional regulator AlpA